ncbi:HAMP domain-containing sensor histidine kinase [Paraglaciecola sp.]|uniref:sensor histidine kinase n=1 Tax=Paraglaciecola sp. TaxID=1920173 RepID=UPI0030F44CE6
MKNNNDNNIDFATVLGCAVHDMKNSLCLLLQSIENLTQSISTENQLTKDHLASAHYEASRLNTGLVQLLSLYRAGLNSLPLNIDQHYIEDVIDELLATNESYLQHKNMILKVEQSEELAWYLDLDLICILLNDMLINAMRYSNKNILLRIYAEDGYLVVKLEDDGPGYPDNMLKAVDINMQNYDIGHGRTGLGLFFARLIAEAHTNGEKQGSIQLQNGGTLGGSVFTLKLP